MNTGRFVAFFFLPAFKRRRQLRMPHGRGGGKANLVWYFWKSQTLFGNLALQESSHLRSVALTFRSVKVLDVSWWIFLSANNLPDSSQRILVGFQVLGYDFDEPSPSPARHKRQSKFPTHQYPLVGAPKEKLFQYFLALWLETASSSKRARLLNPDRLS
ncbi:uncharacterized protein CIMG_07668 [Coccidioides immitis RS]|uniref:Uncharacterized protein n=1 Tax=Coccidioides immitis (strain RS) TaxID=246410 RepID=J3K3V7_COCIM|nr:uncharacterized protein CIMG_07668 [Coccidioides immitis RS]EAS28922.3 hypothetical protein CIMG_07668 [Coccidioides immitis RS]